MIMILGDTKNLINAAPVGSHPQAGWCTPHRYTRSVMLTLGDLTTVQVTGIGHYFTCTVTGAERQFGFDAPSAHGEKEDR